MKRLEDELKNALRRQEPPEDLMERTLLKINKIHEDREDRPRTQFSLFPGWKLRWTFAAIVFLLLIAAGTDAYRQAALEEERRRGEEAKEQLMLALRITGDKLQIVQTRVHQMNANWDYQEGEEGD